MQFLKKMETLIAKYFPYLSSLQIERYQKMCDLFCEWNEKVNVVSRKDIQNIALHHILYSLAIAKFITFQPQTRIVDLGTGGGLPGLPLAVMFSECHFHLIDRIGKKIKVATEIANSLELKNVTFQHGDMGECHEKFDFVVSRAVTDQPSLIKIIKNNISVKNFNAIPNGLITLKGGEIGNELGKFAEVSEIVPVSNYFKEPYFETKKIVYTPILP